MQKQLHTAVICRRDGQDRNTQARRDFKKSGANDLPYLGYYFLTKTKLPPDKAAV